MAGFAQQKVLSLSVIDSVEMTAGLWLLITLWWRR